MKKIDLGQTVQILANVGVIAGILSIPSVRQWWDAGGRTQVAESFANFIESVEADIAIWGWDPELGYIQDDGLERSRRRYSVE